MPTVRTAATLLLFFLMYPARAQQPVGEQEIPLSWDEFVEDFFEKDYFVCKMDENRSI